MLLLQSLIVFLSLKNMTWKRTKNHINSTDPGHRRLKQQFEKNLKINFASASKNGDEKDPTLVKWLKGHVV